MSSSSADWVQTPAMPGSFIYESSLTPKLDVSVRATSHFFQPPSSASSSLHYSCATIFTPSVEDDRSNTKRKRCRADERAPETISSLAYDSPLLSTLISPEYMESPASLANERYRLAGGVDTPTTKMLIDYDRFNSTSVETRFRTGDGRHTPRQSELGYQDGYVENITKAPALARERNGQPRIATSPNFRDGLGRTLHHVAGVAGRVIEFCRSTAIRGFYAGGGVGYELKGEDTRDSEMGEQSIWHSIEKKDFVYWSERDGTSTPVPGRFPEGDFIPDYMSQDHSSPLSTRATKRIQRERGSAREISENWMMVGGKGTPPYSRDVSPSRLPSRKIPVSASAAAKGRRTVPRPGRRPILPASRPSTSHAGSPDPQLDLSASFASPRSPRRMPISPKHDPGSPVGVEVQKHAARIRKRELEEDKSLIRFNQQLKAMIREGKEALGTRVEVEDEIG